MARGADIAVGAGKIDPLEAIAKTGSINAAAREPSISYRRAWLLVDAALASLAVARRVEVWQGRVFGGVARRLRRCGCEAAGTVAGIDAVGG